MKEQVRNTNQVIISKDRSENRRNMQDAIFLSCISIFSLLILVKAHRKPSWTW